MIAPRLAEFLERTCLVPLPPIQQAEARMNLRVIRLHFERFLIGRCRASKVALLFPGDADVIMTGG